MKATCPKTVTPSRFMRMTRLLRIIFLCISLGLFFCASLYYFVTCDCVEYDGFTAAKKRAYSPNGEFYVVRYISRFRAALPFATEPLGTAELFDKDGALLFSGAALVSAEAGPFWFGSICQGAHSPNSVSFFGHVDSPFWTFDLALPPGNSVSIPGC